MPSDFIQSCITQPTRIASRTKPSIDNMFINTVTKSLNAGDIIEKIYDHLPNFLIIFLILRKKDLKTKNTKKGYEEF